MRVRARQVNWDECPNELAPYTKRSQTFLTVGREYEAQALIVFKGFPVLQVVDDHRRPSWYATWLFDIVDHVIPTDWICNFLHEEPSMLLGPEFIVKDEESYGAMVELEADQVDRFWKRLDAMKSDESDESA